MPKLLDDFLDRYFHDEESVIFIALLAVGLVVLLTLGTYLAPIITAIIIAYLLQGLVNTLLKLNVSPGLSVIAVYTLFFSIFIATLFLLLPQAWGQLGGFATEQLPRIVAELQTLLLLLPEKYPGLISEEQVHEWISSIAGFGQSVIVSWSISISSRVIYWSIFIVLVPILVFFVMKDRILLLHWVENLLPRNRPLMSQVWREMDFQMANYIRGKVAEIFIVGTVSYVAFFLLDVDNALLLSITVGLSVVIPYIGATVVTIYVVAVGYIQWGIGNEFYTLVIIYLVIQLIDGNVLVPIIFSEAVNLHPVAIIVAVLVFGGIWGLAGFFFAIPLATLIKATINAWPSTVGRKSL